MNPVKKAFPVLTLCKIKLILFHNSYPSVMNDSYALNYLQKEGKCVTSFHRNDAEIFLNTRCIT